MSEWISVEDRLPKRGQPVQVCRTTYGGHVGCITFDREDFNESGRYWVGTFADFYAHPTHWKPIAPPPEDV